MRSVSFREVTVSLVVLAALGITSTALAAGTKLAYAPKKGDTCKYKYAMTTEAFTIDPDSGKRVKLDMMSVSAYAVFRDKVTAVTDKGATSSYTFEAASTRMMGNKTDVTAPMNGAKLRVTYDRNGLPVSMEGVEKLGMGAMALVGAIQTAMHLPGKAVSPGATWKSDPKQGAPDAQGAGPAGMSITHKFVGIETRGGRTVAKITSTVSGSMEMSSPGAGGGTSGGGAKDPLTAKGTGTAYLDLATGKPVEIVLTINTRIPAGVMGSGPVEMKTSTTLKRIGD